MKRLAALTYSALGTPFSLGLLAALKGEDWDSIATRRIDPKAYTNATEYFLDAQASALLRKCEGLPTSFDRRAKALENWKLGEESCYRANERLAPYVEGKSHPLLDERVYHHVGGIRKIVEAVLGKAPTLDALSGRHGPGATFSDPSKRSTIADKMNSVPSMTPGAYWFLLPWQGTKWGAVTASSEPRRSPRLVRGNRFAVAPKDATKDRPIAAEPSVNIFYQLALGKVVRRRLKGVGIDLDYGQETHRQVARESSITGHLATLDLSNASDTVAYNLVKLLLPPEWFALFEELRSPWTRMSRKDVGLIARHSTNSKGTAWVKLEKFSSMGNGFTFELESLLFYSIVKYTEMCLIDGDEGRTLVYGDDIICNTEIVGAVTSILNFFGFSINREKSFSDGPFRESCGGDFFEGQAVRPYFLKEDPCEPQHFIAAANAVRKASREALGSLDLLRRSWFYLLDQLPSEIRNCRGPEGLGDLCIHDEANRWVTRWRSQSKMIRVYRPHRIQKVPWHVFDPDIVLACALYGAPWGGGGIVPRSSSQSFKLGWIVAYGIGGEPPHLVHRRSVGPRGEDPRFELKPRSVRYRVRRIA